MKKGKYFDPRDGLWHDERPWPNGQMPHGAIIRVPCVLMDGMPADVAAHLNSNTPARALSDAERARERVQGYQDAFDHQRAANPCGRTMHPVSRAYADYCARLQAGAA